MGGRSSAGLEAKLIAELMLGLGDLLGVRGRGCGVTDGDVQEPLVKDCDEEWACSVQDSCDS